MTTNQTEGKTDVGGIDRAAATVHVLDLKMEADTVGARAQYVHFLKTSR